MVPLASWGDALHMTSPEFDMEQGGMMQSQDAVFGDCNDGMMLFEQDGRLLLALNHEFVDRDTFFCTSGPYPKAGEAVPAQHHIQNCMTAHGVSICELVQDDDGRWQPHLESAFNRRINATTPMEITGPARGHELLHTTYDPSGTQAFGTWNNCGSGRTPWGTYLTCEENFNFYFSTLTPETMSPEFLRYGVGFYDLYQWHEKDPRFDPTREPNEPNRAGYVVEIDPWNPDATPRKLTALGRFKHENAEVTLAEDGRVVVYMGDDETGEFLYRFVSEHAWEPGTNGSALLENGTLSVAKFHEDGSGTWAPLTPETTGMSAAEICVYTRMAATHVGATTMDRPEWVSVHPDEPMVMCALTNNTRRDMKPNNSGTEMPLNAVNPRANNMYGQIVRWLPDSEDHAADTFQWDFFAMAGNPNAHPNNSYTGSSNINVHNTFNSPDCIAFDKRGLLWILTDGNDSNALDYLGQGNNQMLVGDPHSGAIHRFMGAPKDGEVTGIAWSPDDRTLFVGIQHPGKGFPDPAMPPRSTVIAIERTDGAVLSESVPKIKQT